MSRFLALDVGTVALLLSCLLFPSSPLASTEGDVKVIAVCESLSEVAENTMELRQLGAPIDVVMVDEKSASPGAPIINEMVIRAYEKPKMHSSQARHVMIQNFVVSEYMRCIQIMKR